MEASRQYRKRNAILDCLRSTDTHPSAEELHRMLSQSHPDISLATVYRNLALFRKQGVIQSIGTVDGMERFDGNPVSHIHFVCTGCSAVVDLPALELPGQLRSAAAETTGGQITGCQLTFSGLCGHCRQE